LHVQEHRQNQSIHINSISNDKKLTIIEIGEISLGNDLAGSMVRDFSGGKL
jgi:hypothetical protein